MKKCNVGFVVLVGYNIPPELQLLKPVVFKDAGIAYIEAKAWILNEIEAQKDYGIEYEIIADTDNEIEAETSNLESMHAYIQQVFVEK